MKRIIAISDIHGCFDELTELLTLVKYHPSNDQLVLLGDYVDKGFQSKEVLKYIVKLSKEGAIVLGGNHEDNFIDWLFSKEKGEEYLYQGGKETIQSLCFANSIHQAKKMILSNYQKEIEFIKNLPNYYEIENYIFVHAGVKTKLPDWRKSGRKFFRTARHTFWDNPNKTGKTIVFGHTPTIHFWENERISNEPYFFENNQLIAIDGGCHSGGQLNALVLEEKNIYYQFVLKK